MSARIDANIQDGVTVVRLSGELTADGVPEVDTALDAVVQSGGGVVVDLTEVRLITTPGIAMLLSANDRVVDRGKKLIFSGLRGPIAEILLQRCRLDLVLTVAPTVEAAVRAVR